MRSHLGSTHARCHIAGCPGSEAVEETTGQSRTSSCPTRFSTNCCFAWLIHIGFKADADMPARVFCHNCLDNQAKFDRTAQLSLPLRSLPSSSHARLHVIVFPAEHVSLSNNDKMQRTSRTSSTKIVMDGPTTTGRDGFNPCDLKTTSRSSRSRSSWSMDSSRSPVNVRLRFVDGNLAITAGHKNWTFRRRARQAEPGERHLGNNTLNNQSRVQFQARSGHNKQDSNSRSELKYVWVLLTFTMVITMCVSFATKSPVIRTSLETDPSARSRAHTTTQSCAITNFYQSFVHWSLDAS